MRVFNRNTEKILGIMSLALLVFAGCSSNTPLLVKSDADTVGEPPEGPAVLAYTQPQRITMAAGDELGMRIVYFHPEVVAQRLSKMNLAYNFEPATF